MKLSSSAKMSQHSAIISWISFPPSYRKILEPPVARTSPKDLYKSLQLLWRWTTPEILATQCTTNIDNQTQHRDIGPSFRLLDSAICSSFVVNFACNVVDSTSHGGRSMVSYQQCRRIVRSRLVLWPRDHNSRVAKGVIHPRIKSK